MSKKETLVPRSPTVETKRRPSFYMAFPKPTLDQSHLLFDAYTKEREGQKGILSEVISKDQFYEDTDAKNRTAESFDTAARVSASVEEFLIRAYLPVADQVVRSLRMNPSDDIYQEGAIALQEAVSKFRPSEEYPNFEKFASLVVKRKLIDYFRKEGEYTRAAIDKLNKVDQSVSDFRNTQLREPTEKEVRDQLGKVSKAYKDEAVLIYTSPRTPLSLDHEESRLKDVLPSRHASPQEVVLNKLVPRTEIVKEAVAKLRPRERAILDAVYSNGETYERIARELGVTPSRISQRVSAIHNKLQSDPELRSEWFDQDEKHTPVQKRNISLSPEQRDERDSLIAELVATTNLTRKEIAEEVSEKLGIPIKPHHVTLNKRETN